MKTTIEISDPLLVRAKAEARKRGQSLRALVEEGLRLALGTPKPPGRYQMPDRSVGNPKGKNPLEAMSWQDLRAEIYGGR